MPPAAIGALARAAAVAAARRRTRPAVPARPVSPAAPQFPTQPSYSWESDPLYQQTQGQANATLRGNLALYGASRRSLLTDYGLDPSLDYGDDATRAAAAANPFSTLKNLSHTHDLRAQNLDESLNKANLYYSGYRGKQLGEESRQYLGEQSAAATALRNALAGIARGELEAQGNYQQTLQTAGQTAYQNALAFALQNPSTLPSAAGGAAGYSTPAVATTASALHNAAVASLRPRRRRR